MHVRDASIVPPSGPDHVNHTISATHVRLEWRLIYFLLTLLNYRRLSESSPLGGSDPPARRPSTDQCTAAPGWLERLAV